MFNGISDWKSKGKLVLDINRILLTNDWRQEELSCIYCQEEYSEIITKAEEEFIRQQNDSSFLDFKLLRHDVISQSNFRWKGPLENILSSLHLKAGPCYIRFLEVFSSWNFNVSRVETANLFLPSSPAFYYLSYECFSQYIIILSHAAVHPLPFVTLLCITKKCLVSFTLYFLIR